MIIEVEGFQILPVTRYRVSRIAETGAVIQYMEEDGKPIFMFKSGCSHWNNVTADYCRMCGVKLKEVRS